MWVCLLIWIEAGISPSKTPIGQYRLSPTGSMGFCELFPKSLAQLNSLLRGLQALIWIRKHAGLVQFVMITVALISFVIELI